MLKYSDDESAESMEQALDAGKKHVKPIEENTELKNGGSAQKVTVLKAIAFSLTVNCRSLHRYF